VSCAHDGATHEESDDTFATIIGVELVEESRTLTVCSECGAALRSERTSGAHDLTDVDPLQGLHVNLERE
jgi:hypothetical protein